MVESGAPHLRRHPLAITAGLLAVYVFVGGLMILADAGPAWYRDSVGVANIALMIPLLWLLRQRTTASPD